MQQTQNLNLNLIESTDPVDWTPLNANMETLESAIVQTQTDTAAALGTGGQTARIAYGSFAGTGGAKTLKLEFKPLLVFITVLAATGYYTTAVMTRECGTLYTIGGANVGGIVWGDNSFTYSHNDYNPTDGRTVHYVAIGV
jgi:hypothetical protein